LNKKKDNKIEAKKEDTEEEVKKETKPVPIGEKLIESVKKGDKSTKELQAE